jgi:hypothetical protein
MMNRRDFLTAVAGSGAITSLPSPVGAKDTGFQSMSFPHDGTDQFERDDWVPHHTLDINEDGITTLSISLEGPNAPSSITLNSRRATVMEVVEGEDALSSGQNSYSWDVERASSVAFRIQLGDKSGRGMKTAVFENSIASDLNEIVQVNQWPEGTDSLPKAYRFTFNPPDGWAAVSPGEQVAADTFDINPGIIQYGSSLKDLYAVGDFDVHERDAGETTIRYAQLPEGEHPYEIEEAIDLMADATPVIEAMYGPNLHYPWAAIFVPSPWERGGFIKDHSIIFGDEDPLLGDGGSTYTHEMGGLYTRAIACTSKRCSRWYITGAKSWVGRLYALYATDRIDHEELRRMLRAWINGSNDARDHEDPLRVPVTDSPYTKGTAISVLLDMEIRARTDGAQDIGAWLREISDQRILQYSGDGRALINDEEARPLLYEITGVDYTEFYERYVHGSEFPEKFVEETFSIENPWPIYEAFEYPRVDIPESEVAVGEPIEVTVEMRNDADKPQQRTLQLVVDGRGVAATEVQLDPGESTTVTLEHTFSSAGEYVVGVPPARSATISVAGEPTSTTSQSPTSDATSPSPNPERTSARSTTSGTAEGSGAATASPGQPGLGVLTALAGVGSALGLRLHQSDADDK